MSEERDLFSCHKPLVRSGANRIQARVLCLPTMPDRNNTNQVPRRRFPPEPRHSPCQYEWVLAADTSLLSQKSVGAELLTPQSKRFSDDFASGSPQSGAAREPRREFFDEVKASTICGGKEPQALMRAPCIYARCRELCLAATQRRQ